MSEQNPDPLSQICTDFENYLLYQRFCSESSAKEYVRTIRSFLFYLRNELNVKSWKKFRMEHLRGFMAILTKKGNSYDTQTTKLMQIRTFFSYLEDDRLISSKVAIDVRKKFKRKREPVLKQTTISEEEFQKMLDATKETRSPARNALMLKILYETGFRVSEFISITPKMVSPRALIDLESRKGKKTKLQITFGMISEPTYLELDFYILHKEIGEKERIFPYNRKNAFYLVKRLSQLAGIKKTVSPHTLRHTWSSRFAKKTKDIYALKLLGGWLSRAYERYTHYTEEDLRPLHAKAFS